MWSTGNQDPQGGERPPQGTDHTVGEGLIKSGFPRDRVGTRTREVCIAPARSGGQITGKLMLTTCPLRQVEVTALKHRRTHSQIWPTRPCLTLAPLEKLRRGFLPFQEYHPTSLAWSSKGRIITLLGDHLHPQSKSGEVDPDHHPGSTSLYREGSHRGGTRTHLHQ